ncbi:MAG: diadenylate cyclase CdaA [Lachnospiraceae bacterium]|nr:diadenylate cyclase CdaA [Lachnospiraceae bacterium]MBR4412569.1 diadenylate cyclase CdaA [Lachnospiraceae bacterium]MBR5067746.1 diadenylate cyclase CdaA [Lachnospiraceae bacterium]MBR5917338.1 diadenylate cyclase CdaA [Lachnospiraceae bacterium]
MFDYISKYLTVFRLPRIGILDVFEIIILAFLLYQVMKWMKNTRAWSVVKGLAVILVFMAIAEILDMTTIIWIGKSLFTLGAVAIIVALQPEIRRLIEDLGKNNLLTTLILLGDKQNDGRFSDKTLNEIISASFEMGRSKTGALIVIEVNSPLEEYERTGITVDGVVSSQLLVNIFEHNTPLHDGAVIIRGDRVQSATCYLPLSDNRSLSKELGTRHRAGVGISEVTDALVIIVSEETGKVSVAQNGELFRSLDVIDLRRKLESVQDKKEGKSKKNGKKKGEEKDEAKADA